MRISDWSSDVCSSDLMGIAFADLAGRIGVGRKLDHPEGRGGSGKSVAFWAGADQGIDEGQRIGRHLCGERPGGSRQQQRAEERRPPHRTATMEGLKHGCRPMRRSEEHTSELQSLMRISYAVFCLKTKHISRNTTNNTI